MNSDYDGAWKDLLRSHLRECLECYFPHVARAIDWKHRPVFLDQELKALAISLEAPGNRVDILVEVRLKGGARQQVQSALANVRLGRVYKREERGCGGEGAAGPKEGQGWAGKGREGPGRDERDERPKRVRDGRRPRRPGRS